VATSRNVVVVDKSLPLEQLAPLACGIQTGAGTMLSALDVQPGTSVAVFGAGAVGLAAVMAAKVAGATTIVVVDLHEHRLQLAKELGATHTIDGNASDLVGQILGITGGGAHYALDTTGVPAVITAALQGLRMTGACALVAVQQGDLVLDGAVLLGKTLVGVFEGSVVPQEFIPRMIELWQDGKFPFDRLIETFPLSQINEAEQASISGKVIKPVLVVG
jgi:aryl-alcohol dehydrogenase